MKVKIIKANIEDLKKLFPEQADNIEGLVNFALGSWIHMEQQFRATQKGKAGKNER